MVRFFLVASTVFCHKMLARRLKDKNIWTLCMRNLAKFAGKHLCQSLFFNKVVGLQICNFIKKKLWHGCFPVNFARPTTLLNKRFWHRCFPANFAKFLRTPFLQNTHGWLLLIVGPYEFWLIDTKHIPLKLRLNSNPN